MSDWWNRNRSAIIGCWPVLVLVAIPFLLTLPYTIQKLFERKPTCVFDRNEIGPMGEYGQWYWEYYKCSDGTERRQLVAGPRG